MTTPHFIPCAATGCQRRIPSNLLMCMDHWRMVPAPLARNVVGAARAQNRATNAAEHQAARDAFFDLKSRAVLAVAAKQMARVHERDATEGSLFA